MQSIKINAPDDFQSEMEFVEWVRKTYEDDLAADKDNRDAALEDSKFLANEQWDEVDEAYRKDLRLPVLTVNQLPAFVGTVIGNRRLNQSTIRVSPDTVSMRAQAQLREGIIASILKNSTAKRALDKGFENQVTTGIGNFGIALDYANNDVFDQDIMVYTIPNALAVVWDRHSIDPTGRDAQHAFLSETVTEKDFDRRWPDAKGGELGAEVDSWARDNGWISGSDKRVLTVWRMVERKKTLAMFGDGTTRDITNISPEQLADGLPGSDGKPTFVVVNPKTQQPMIREAPALAAQRWVVSAHEVLEGPYELPIDRLPIIRMMGWEVNVGPRRVRWGLVRLAKDPQRLLNFWRSVVAEKLLYAPKATVMGPATAFEGRREKWRDLHLTREPLEYNEDTPHKPEFIQPPTPDVALLQQASLATQDMRDVLNLHEASMGMSSNEVSGKAIFARQRIGEIGTVIYNDNANDALTEAGRVINQLIPVAYDTPRYIKVSGYDEKEEIAAINQGPDTDVTLGTYSITLHTGPSYVTKRAEAAEAMLNFVNAAPQTAAIAPDLIVEAQDWPNAEAIAARFRRSLPSHLLDPSDLTPEQQQQAQQQSQVAEMQFMMELENQEADTAGKRAAAIHSEAMAEEAIARAVQARAQAAAAMEKVDNERLGIISDFVTKERDRIADAQNAQVAAASKARDANAKKAAAEFAAIMRARSVDRATAARQQPKAEQE